MRFQFAGGVDVGSCTTKGVIIDKDGNILASRVIYSGTDFSEASKSVWADCLAEADLSENDDVVVYSTGYGRNSVTFASGSMTEIACHGRGCFHLFGGPITVVDIGGQDNKVIKLDSHGRRVSFKMNRKCAAGTGAFLEEMALRLRLPIEKLNSLAEQADREIVLGSYCTVFSATEVLEKIKAGHRVDRIVRGLFHSVVKRILEMDTLTDTIVMTGGVIEHNPFLMTLMRDHTQCPVVAAPRPQITGALGAALYAIESVSSDGD